MQKSQKNETGGGVSIERESKEMMESENKDSQTVNREGKQNLKCEKNSVGEKTTA